MYAYRVTASGKLVIPMQCQAVLERQRGPVDSQLPVQLPTRIGCAAERTSSSRTGTACRPN